MIPAAEPTIARPPEVEAALFAAEQSAVDQEAVDRAAALGGEAHTVRLRDGTGVAVTLRVLGLRELPRYVEARFSAADEVAALEQVCGQPAGWGDTVHPADQLRLLRRANELNFPQALLWMQDQTAMLRQTAAILGRAAPKTSGRPAPGSATSSGSA